MIKATQCMTYDVDGKKEVKTVHLKMSAGWDDMCKQLQAASAWKPNHRIEALVNSTYVDITTEDNFNKHKPTLRYLERLKISFPDEPPSENENSDPRGNGSTSSTRSKTPSGRSKTPTANIRTAFGEVKQPIAGMEVNRNINRNSSAQRQRPPMTRPVVNNLTIAVEPLSRTSSLAINTQPISISCAVAEEDVIIANTEPSCIASPVADSVCTTSVDEYKVSPSFKTVSKQSIDSVVKLRKSLDKVANVGASPNSSTNDTADIESRSRRSSDSSPGSLTLGDSPSLTRSTAVKLVTNGFIAEKILCPMLSRDVSFATSSRRTSSEGPEAISAFHLDDCDQVDIQSLDQNDHISELDQVVVDNSEMTPGCLFHTLTPSGTPVTTPPRSRLPSMMNVLTESSLMSSSMDNDDVEQIQSLNSADSLDEEENDEEELIAVEAGADIDVADEPAVESESMPEDNSTSASGDSEPTVDGVPINPLVLQSPVNVSKTVAAIAKSKAIQHRMSTAPRGRTASPSILNRQSVLTAGELNSRFTNNIRNCDYNRIVTGGVLAAANTTPVKAREVRVTASPARQTRVVHPGQLDSLGSSGTNAALNNKIPGSGITRGNVTPGRSTSRGRSATSATGSMSKRASTAVGSYGSNASSQQDDDITGSPVFQVGPTPRKKKKAGAADGGEAMGNDRLSMGTLIRQLGVLQKITGMSEEDIDWSAVKDEPGAYKHALKKHSKADDNYYKSIFEIDLYAKVKQYVNTSSHCKIHALLQSIVDSNDDFFVNTTDPKATEKVHREKLELLDYLTTPTSYLMASQLHLTTGFENPTILSDFLYKQLMDCLDTPKEKDISRKMKLIVSTIYPQECREVAERHRKSESLNADSLEDMEKWDKRKTGTKGYAEAQKHEEMQWMMDEFDKNSEALETMRSYLSLALLGTLTTSAINISEFNAMILEKGGVFSNELQIELKTNKCLHWCIKHADDIVNASFLTGESKAYFENLECYDIIECRALVLALAPLSKFNNDNDGKKWEWRNRLYAKCKQMIDQENGVEVKGAWNGKEGKRSMVKLPGLSSNQQRRTIYYHKTYAQYMAKLKQYDDKIALLAKKQVWLVDAKTALDEATAEWTTLLTELRDEKVSELLTVCSKDQINDLKKEAANQKQAADKRHKEIQQDVTNLQKTIENNPISREQFVIAKEQLEGLLLKSGIVYSETKQPVMIVGVFDRNPKIIKSEVPMGAKFLSPEEEAAIRQQEILRLRADAQQSSPTESDNGTVSDISSNDSGSCKTPGRLNARVAFLEQQGQADKTPHRLNGAVGRRNSVLNNCNPDLLRSISNSISGRASIMVNRGDLTASSSTASSSDAVTIADAPVEKKSVPTMAAKDLNSKFLKRMMGVQDESVQPVTTPMMSPMRMFGGGAPGTGGGLSFLEQIKLGKSGRTPGGPLTPPPGGGMSFLDQIKMGKTPSAMSPVPSAAAGAGVSFLDQIKMGKQGMTPKMNQDSSLTPVRSLTQDTLASNSPMPSMNMNATLVSPVPTPALSPMRAMSFLDEIKLKAKKHSEE